MGPESHDLAARRAALAMRIAYAFAGVGVVLAVLGQTPYAVGVPSATLLLPLSVVMALSGELARRRARHAPLLVPWIVACTVPFVIVEPEISTMPDHSIFLAPVAGLVLADARTLWGTTALQMVILIARCPPGTHSPYLEPSFVVVAVALVGGMALAQRTLVGALVDVTRHRTIEGAAARAGNEILLWAPAKKGLARVVDVSSSVEALLGYAPGDVVGRETLSFVHPEDVKAVRTAFVRAVRSEERKGQVECRLKHADGRWVWCEVRIFDSRRDPKVFGLVAAVRDIRVEHGRRQAHAAELLFQAQHDPLTRLPNRRKLERDLSLVSEEKPTRAWLFFCDLDSFKHVNDGLGHDIGDALLVAVSSWLLDVAGPNGLYRFGGDEFVVLAKGLSESEAQKLAARVLEVGSVPFDVLGHRLFVTVSVGMTEISSFDDPRAALRSADMAMYSAKAAGRNQARLFDRAMRETSERRHAIGQALRDALGRGELYLAYQPKVDTHTLPCVGFEALMRWRSPELGNVSPGEFIPVAEETGLVADLGDFAVREVCRTIAEWSKLGVHVPISANVSAAQLADRRRTLDSLSAALRESGIAPELLELEITESALVGDAEQVAGLLKEIRALGVSISVDDFGTGYSSLAYVRRFPVSSLKIDRSFVVDLVEKSEARHIVAAVLALAKNLGLETIAEGVETEAQRVVLSDLGCDMIQGYLVARPLPPEGALEFVRQNALAESQEAPIVRRRVEAMRRTMA